MEEPNHLRAQIDLLQAALDHVNQGFSVFDSDLRLVAWNRGLWEMLDFPQELARRGTHLEAFLRVNAQRGEYGPGDIEGKIQRRLARAKLFESHYFERIRPNGQVISVSGTPLPQGGFVTTYTDVTEERRRQKKLERTVEERTRALRQSEDWLRLVTDNIPALIAYLAPGPVFRFANRKYAEWFGQSVTSIVGRAAAEVVGAELFKELAPQIEHAFRGNAVSYEYERKRLDGQPVFMRSTLIPDMTKDGRTLGIFVLSLDATDQKRNEVTLLQSQRMDAVGKLSGGLAHDFNNLLSILMGNLLALRRKSGTLDAETLATHLTPMLQATHRGADLTQRLLAFSRGKPIDPKKTPLKHVIDSVAGLLEGSLPASIGLDIGGTGDPAALIDPSQLETALINLAFNARDAMPDGGCLKICLGTCVLGDAAAKDLGIPAGNYARIDVADTGVGMNDDIRFRIFEPFFTTKSFGTGSGLGLSMVYGFTQQSGGAIAIESAPGQGTTVSMFLPAIPVSTSDLIMGEEVDKLPIPRGAGELVLVVEDNPDVAAILADQLAAIGYATLLAENAEDARSLAVDLPELRAVLSDIVMPGQMNGLTLAREIRKKRPELGIVLMTGYADWSQLDPNEGDCGFLVLSKPFGSDRLARTLKQLLAHESFR